MSVRPARPRDADRIAEISWLGWRVAYAGVIDASALAARTLADVRAEWAPYVRAVPDDHVLLVGQAEATVVGFVRAGPAADGDLVADTGEVYGLYVDPSWQGGGVGRELLTAACEELHRRGAPEATLWAFADNDSALSFYERLGWRRDGASRLHEAGALEVRLRVPSARGAGQTPLAPELADRSRDRPPQGGRAG